MRAAVATREGVWRAWLKVGQPPPETPARWAARVGMLGSHMAEVVPRPCSSTKGVPDEEPER